MNDDTFERLLKFQNDPERLDEECNKIMEEYIESCPPERQQKLRAFVWRQNQELSKYKDPIARYNRSVELFWEQFAEFQKSLQGWAVSATSSEPIVEEPIHEATVLKFEKKKKEDST